MKKIDKLDISIVDLLMQDGRMSATDIARRLGGVTERTVRYRMERLIEEGVIQVSAIVNPKALGFVVVADIFIDVETAYIEEIARKIAGYENVSYVACSIGDKDISVQIVAHDNAEIYSFVTEVIARIPGVRKTTTSIVPLTVLDVYQWKIPASICQDENSNIA